MVGRPVSLDVEKTTPKLGEVTLSVKDLTISDHTGRALVRNVSFDVHAGEILAVAGVQGNGQSYRDWETDRKSTRLNSSHRL